MEEKNLLKGNGSFEVLPFIDNSTVIADDLESTILEFPSDEAINMVSSTLARSITEDTFWDVYESGKSLADSEYLNQVDSEDSDDDFVKIEEEPLQMSDVFFQPKENKDVEFAKSDSNDQDIFIVPSIKRRKAGYEIENLNANTSLNILKENVTDQVGSTIQISEIPNSENASATLTLPAQENFNEKSVLGKKSSVCSHYIQSPNDHSQETEPILISSIYDFENEWKSVYQNILRSPLPEEINILRSPLPDELNIFESLGNLCLIEGESLEGYDASITEALLEPIHEQFAQGDVFPELRRDFRRCWPGQSHYGRSICSRGLCEVVCKTVQWCQRIKQNFLTSLNNFLSAFEEEINDIVGTPFNVTVVGISEIGGAAIARAAALGLEGVLEVSARTVLVRSVEPCSFLGIQTGLKEAKKRVQTAKLSGVVNGDGIVVTTAPVLFETDENVWQSAILLYLEDPRLAKDLHCLTSTVPLTSDGGHLVSPLCLERDRLDDITAAADILAKAYYGLALRSGLLI